MPRFDSSELWEPSSDVEREQTAAESAEFGPGDMAGWSGGSSDGDDDQGFTAEPIAMARAAARAFFLPLHYEANYRYPLVVWLHNDGFNEAQINCVMPHISVRNYVAAGVRAPRAVDAKGHRFEWSRSDAAVDAAHDSVMQAIDAAQERFSIHPSRIVLAGYKAGGTMAMTIAMREPSLFAGVVTLGGYFSDHGRLFNDLLALRRRQLPMLWQWASESHGFRNDQIRRDIQTAMMLKAKVEIRQYNDDDEMNTVALADINDWIMSRVVAGQDVTASDCWGSHPTAFSSN